MRRKLVLFPMNGNAHEALDCIDESCFEVLGFIDDDQSKKPLAALPVLGREVLKDTDILVLAVPGSPTSFPHRAAIIASLGVSEDRFVSIIHPTARIGRQVRIGRNCLIMAGVVLTSNAVVGNHVCILPNTVVHHDSSIGDYTLVGSNVAIAGGTIIGGSCYIGSGTNIINGIRIGDGTLVGMGANVIADVPGSARMVGNPARNLANQA